LTLFFLEKNDSFILTFNVAYVYYILIG